MRSRPPDALRQDYKIATLELMTRYFSANISDILKNLSSASLQPKDFIDVLIVAFLIYAILLLLKRTHASFILAGILVFVVVYLAARFFNFYLTGIMLQAFFTSFIVILVIIFQKELRNFFEWISVSGRAALKRKSLTEVSENEIVQAAEYLAHHKIGALMVLAGKQPIDRFVESGINLDGEISVPLILSILDPTSPGHDGALIIEGNKIKKFSAHLPLATRFKKIGNLGTRHRAALGLAQSSDAFVIVVSEERGVISVAHQGNLRELVGAGDLKTALDRFVKEKILPSTAPWWRNLLFHNLREKIIAVVLAALLWFIFASPSGILSREFEVPIEVRFQPLGLIVETNPKAVNITLSGRIQNFELLNPGGLKVLIDASEFREGTQKIKMEEKLISRPGAFSVTAFSPKTIQITAKKSAEGSQNQ